MRAALFRTWKQRVKGRDWYDIVWFIRKKTPLQLSLFSALGGEGETLDRDAFLKMANERIDQMDVPSAIEDIVRFVRDAEAVRKTWSKEFFRYWMENLVTRP